VGTFEKFEDIHAWQKARELTNRVYRFTGQGLFQKDFGLKDQIRKASVSIMSNIAEGSERDTDKDFSRFLVIAKASTSEVRSQLYIAKDQGYLNNEDYENTYALTIEIGGMLKGLIKYLRKDGNI